MIEKIKNKLYSFIKPSYKNSILTIIVLVFAFVICFLIRSIDESTVAVSMIFILAVFLVSRFTNGYFYGTVASFISVLGVNFVFTYPYFEFNFTLAGYPIAIISMLVVAVTTSALTTQIKQHELIRLEAEKEKTRSNLLRSVSHDLRTPLTSILGASSAIIENDDVITKENRLKLVAEINEDAQWLIRMVENLLSITRIDNNTEAKIIKKPEAAEEVVAEAVMKFKKRFINENVSVIVPDELLIIPMDSVLIEQVILNLLENSAIHSKTATRIDVSVEKSNNFAIFTVCDNGKGIDSEVLPNIFEGYFKKNCEDSGDKKRNMGIGLSVCYSVIRAHGGMMRAENSKSGGAVFNFSLPLEEYSNE